MFAKENSKTKLISLSFLRQTYPESGPAVADADMIIGVQVEPIIIFVDAKGHNPRLCRVLIEAKCVHFETSNPF